MFRQIASFVCTLCGYKWIAPYDPTKGIGLGACPKCRLAIGVHMQEGTVRTETVRRV